MPTPYPDEKSKAPVDPRKSNGTLDFSDLTSSLPPRVRPVSDHDQPFASAQAPVTEPPMPSANPQPTQPTGSPQPDSVGSTLPVFRNPQGNATRVDLAEIGAPIEPAHDIINRQTKPLPKLRFNLSPNFDTFSAHGLQIETQKQDVTTLLGKITTALQLAKIFSKRNLRYAGIGAVSFLVFMLVFNFGTLGVQLCYQTKIDAVCKVFKAAPPQAVAPVVTPTAAPTAAVNVAQAIDSPDVIIIPKLNVNAPIVFEPSIAEEAIQTALRNGVVHYAGTALPGEPSNAVIVGHSSNDWWEAGNYKFVFALLDKLEAGDQIQINYQKKRYIYQVAAKKIVLPSEISVLQPTSEPVLTLITCTPPGTSWKRLVVSANQIEPSPNKPEQQPQIATVQNTNDAALPGNAPSFFEQIMRFIGLHKDDDTNSTPSTQPSPSSPSRNYLPQAV